MEISFESKNLVSIIVPCYNMERYLEKSINSILNNSYENKEIILVNDGSTDKTLDILERYNHLACIKIISKHNGGVSSARNAGLQIARGEFIMFVDPDDTVSPSFIQTAVSAITEGNGYDLVQFGFSTNRGWSYTPAFIGEYHSNKDILTKYFSKMLGYTSDDFQLFMKTGHFAKRDQGQIYKCIFRNSIIKRYNLAFPPHICSGEDQMFLSEYLLYTNSMKNIADILYNYNILDTGAFMTNISGKNIKKTLQNKLLLLQERMRLAALFSEKINCNKRELYAGSSILSCLQLGVLASKHLSGYYILSTYAHIPEVEECIKLINLDKTISLKRLLPTLLLYKKQYKTLFFLLYFANKFKINPNIQ